MERLKDEKKRADVLMKQLEEGWKNFDRRRAYEWKLSIAIWTALAAFIALAMRGEIRTPSQFQFLLAIPALGIIALHLYFNIRVKLANDVDKRKAELCEDLLNGAAGVTEADLSSVRDAIKKVAASGGNWSKYVHVGITTFLILAAAFVFNSRSESPDKDAHPSSQPTSRADGTPNPGKEGNTTGLLAWLPSILAIGQIPFLIVALILTRNHFRKARAAHFIERFNSPDMIAVRVSVDHWLDSSSDHQELLRALESDSELKVKVKVFANLFVELGAAYEERSVDRHYINRVFAFVVKNYWAKLSFWINDYREKAQRRNLYDAFETLCKVLR